MLEGKRMKREMREKKVGRVERQHKLTKRDKLVFFQSLFHQLTPQSSLLPTPPQLRHQTNHMS